MKNKHIYDSLLIAIFMMVVIGCFGCSRNSHIPSDLDRQLRSNDVKDIQADFEFQAPEFPDKKYLALTVTYNFSTADGTPQKEYRGFILKLDNGSWTVDRASAYTKSGDKAKSLLEGKK
jgi:hypothetical protein